MNLKYTKLNDSELSNEEDDVSYSKDDWPRPRRCNFWLTVPLCVSISLNVFFILYILRTGRNWTAALSSEPRQLLGYDTELYEARKVIDQVQLQFDGGFTFVPNMGGTHLHFTGPERYFGTPSPAIDQVWEELLKGEYIELNDTEAIGIKHTLYDTKPDGSKLYFVILDVYHQLHCLNEARKFIDPEYYNDPTWSEAFKRVNRLHLDHCMNYIRQAIMCHSDLTPILAHWDDTTKKPQAEFETVHTCRNFEQVNRWVAARRRHTVLDDPATI